MENENKTPADVAATIGAIDATITQKFTKTVFRDLLTGLKILIKFMQQNDVESHTVMLQWLKLYLRVENALDPNDGKLREQFEKYIPATISYIIAALQYKPKDIPQYHFQLLDLSHKLLEKVSEHTLKKVANLESGLIACLWLPIDFVGDFNTQMAALRLLIQLLKCIDDTKQHQELEKICTSQKTVLRDNICEAVNVANFHSGKFENAARVLLNNYNMNLAKNVLVYSMRCKSVKFGKTASFYKLLNTDFIWLDLNHSPRTLTFNGRYRASSKEKFVNVGVCLQIRKLTLQAKTLSVVLSAPPHFTKNISNQNKLKTLRNLQFELFTDEALRLRENHVVIKYFNEEASMDTNVENTIMTPSNASDTTSEDGVEISSAANNVTKVPEAANDVAIQKTPLAEVSVNDHSMDNFERSYNILIGISGEMQKQNKTVTTTADRNSPTLFNSQDFDVTFKIPSLTYYENAQLKTKLFQKSNKNINNLSQETKAETSALTQALIAEESPKTSHLAEETTASCSQKNSHPITKLTQPNGTGKRRFFTGKNKNSDSDTNQGVKKRKLTKYSVKKRVTKYEHIFTSPPKRKQINKVKPMNHLAKNDGDPEEAVQEYVENGGIINITNFLRNNNESAAVFNEDERRIILQNVHRINENLECSAKKFFKKSGENQTTSAIADNQVNDLYDERNVSEAEPGKSYRNFRVRRKKVEEPYMEKSKPKTNKRRSNVTKTKKTTTVKKNPGINSREENDMNVASTSKVEVKTKRRVIKRKAATTAPTVVNTTAPETTVSHSIEQPDKLKNKTTYSQDIQIDLTCLDDDVEEIKEPDHSGRSHTQAKKSNVSISTLEPPAKKVRISRDVFEQAKQCVRRSLTSSSSTYVENNDNNNNKNKNITTLSPMTISESSFKLNNIQECRHDVSIEQLLADESIWRTPTTIRSCNDLHSPCLSDAMNVSEINESLDKVHDRKLISNRESNCIKTLFPEVTNLNNTVNNTENNHQTEVLPADNTEQPIEECILYHERSDVESSGTDNESTEERTSLAHLEQVRSTPNKVSVEHIATKSITRSTRTSVSGNQPKLQTCEVRTTSVTTHQIISQDLFLVPTTSAEASSVSPEIQNKKSVNEIIDKRAESNANLLIAKLPDLNEISHCMMPYNKTCQDLDIMHNPLCKDIFVVLQNFKEKMKQEFEKLDSRMKLEAYIAKVVDVSKRLLVEAENERLDMEQSEKELVKIMRQLNWHWESFQKKTERFNCFKQNIYLYLNALAEIDFEADINNEFEQFLTKLCNKGTELSTQIWQEFIKQTTENLLQNISNFSTL